jgi:hypothetical protein
VPIGLQQVIAHQVKQQGFDLSVFQPLHFKAVFQVEQRIQISSAASIRYTSGWRAQR